MYCSTVNTDNTVQWGLISNWNNTYSISITAWETKSLICLYYNTCQMHCKKKKKAFTSLDLKPLPTQVSTSGSFHPKIYSAENYEFPFHCILLRVVLLKCRMVYLEAFSAVFEPLLCCSQQRCSHSNTVDSCMDPLRWGWVVGWRLGGMHWPFNPLAKV